MIPKNGSRLSDRVMRKNSMRHMHRIVLVAVLAAATPALTGCAGFDPESLDIFGLGDKKKLPGDRKPLFPEGVPGVSQGIPPEYIKGNQPPPETADLLPAGPANPAANSPANASPQQAAIEPAEEPKPKPKRKPRVAKQKLIPDQAPRPAQNQSSGQAPPPAPWPAPNQQQPQQSSSAPWPASPAPGSFSR